MSRIAEVRPFMVGFGRKHNCLCMGLNCLLRICRDCGYSLGMSRLERITLDPNKRGGKPCIRGLRITVIVSQEVV